MEKSDVVPPIAVQSRSNKKKLLLALAVLVALLLGGGAAWYLLAHKEKPQAAKDKPSVIINQALNTRDGVSRLRLEAALQNNPTKEEKQQLLQFLANDAQKNNDFQAAVNYLKQAYDAGLKTANLAQSIGTLDLEKLHNKPEALKYFKLGAEAAKTNQEGDPFSGNILSYLEQKITELEGEGVKAAN